MGQAIQYENTMALFLIMKNLLGRETWDKEVNEVKLGKLEQWWADVESNLLHLNFKVDLLLKRLFILIPPTPMVIQGDRLTAEGPQETERRDTCYVLL